MTGHNYCITGWPQSFYTDRQDKILEHLNHKIQERGDTDKNDEEDKACEIVRTICKNAVQAEYKVFDAGLADLEESIRTHNKLSSIGKRRTIREAHIMLTKIN